MRRLYFGMVLFLIYFSAYSQNWQMVWHDEFLSPSIDASKWSYDIGGNGWGNNELQYYTDRPENSYIENGKLVIEARKENYGGRSYTSARMVTKFKGDWKYGKIMVRAKLPYGQGIWPAIWMLPTDYVYGGWPSSGEVDIMEMLGHQTSIIYGSLHFGSDSPYIHDFTTASTSLSGEDFSQDFHIFEINWFPTKIEWYVDGILYQTLTDWYTSKASFPAPFDQRFHLLLNIAVGGNWPGNPDNTTTFPQRMEVDFVRVYQDTNAIPTVTISSPQNGTVWTSGTQQKVTVQADGHQYGITTVALYQDEVKLGEVNEPPYEFILTDVQPGVYKLRAVATNTLGIDGVSDEYTVTVSGSSQFSPVTIAPQYIPGTLEIENYDMGGENVAYHDIDAVNNAKYNGTFFRTMEGVDVEKTLDPNGGEYNVGWLETGEWLNYSVKIQESADYDVVYRVSSPSGGQFRVLLDGQDISGTINVPATGGWQSWADVQDVLSLPGGNHKLKIEILQGGFNFNYITFNSNTLGIDDNKKIPESIRLYQNYPNPFNPTTLIRFYLNQTQQISLEVFNLEGQKVITLLNKEVPAGEHQVSFDAAGLPSGVYIYRLQSGNKILSKKMMLLK